MTQKFSVKKLFIKPALAMVVALGAAGAPSFAQAVSPEGTWWPDNKESRYEFSFCRGDNKRLCAKLIWIREDQRDAKNMKYLNTYIFTSLKPKGSNQWGGGLKIKGITGNGVITMKSEDRMSLKACAFMMCDTINLSRAPSH